MRSRVPGAGASSGTLAGHVAHADPEGHDGEQEGGTGDDRSGPALEAHAAWEPVVDEEEAERSQATEVVDEELQRPQALVEELDADDGLHHQRDLRDD